MQLFENSGTLGDFLQRAYTFLMIVKHISVESECAFSEAGLFATKSKSRMEDETLDVFCFLKTYFKNIITYLYYIYQNNELFSI